MHKLRTSLHRQQMDEKVVLSGLWVSTLFVFTYVDVIGFWRKDIINGALAGKVPGTGFGIDQAFLTLSTGYIVVPSLMVAASLLAPARVNRLVNLIVSLLYLASVVATAASEHWTYYILGSSVEVVLLLAIAGTAWTWRQHPRTRLQAASSPSAPTHVPR